MFKPGEPERKKSVERTAAETTAHVVPKMMLPYIDVTELPSHFLPYPTGIKVSYRPYTFGEVKNYSGGSRTPLKALDILMDGITVTGMDKLDLTVPDVSYLGLLRKISTFGPSEVNITSECSNVQCGKDFSFVIDSNTISYAELKVSVVPITLDIEGTPVQIAPMTYRAYYDLLLKERRNDPIANYASMIRNLPYDRAYRLLSNASYMAASAVEQADIDLYHGVEVIKRACPHCLTVNEVEIDGGAVLVEPFRGRSEHDQS